MRWSPAARPSNALDAGRRTMRPPARAGSPTRSSGSRTSTSRSSPASWSRWSVRPGPARPRRPTSCRGSTTWIAGAVEIDGIDVRQIALASLGQIIGFVTQETYLFHATVRENLVYAKPDATDEEIRGSGALGRDPRPHHGAARGLRHDRRRARLQAVRRREAARGPRARAAEGPADHDPGRGDVIARHGLRAAHPAGARTRHARSNDDRDRAPAVDDPARRPDPGLRAGPHRGTRHAPRAASRPVVSTPGCTTSSSNRTTRDPGDWSWPSRVSEVPRC